MQDVEPIWSRLSPEDIKSIVLNGMSALGLDGRIAVVMEAFEPLDMRAELVAVLTGHQPAP